MTCNPISLYPYKSQDFVLCDPQKQIIELQIK